MKLSPNLKNWITHLFNAMVAFQRSKKFFPSSRKYFLKFRKILSSTEEI